MLDQYPRQSSDNSFDILLAEDNPADVRLFEEALQTVESETTLHVVTNGDEAVNFLKRRGEHESAVFPDLVFLDLNLPHRDGCEVLDTIRADSQLQRLPVIMLTSSKSREDIARCYDAAANAYLTKPTGSDEFTALVESIEQFWLQTIQLPPVPN